MRFLLVFLAIFAPLSWVLWRIAGDAPDLPDAEDSARIEAGDPVLDSSEVPYAPIDAELLRLENVRFQRFHETEAYVVFWVHAEGLERVDGKPRVRNITAAMFGEPVDGQENVKLRITAPYLVGEPAKLLAEAGQQKELRLGGGVQVFDGVGRVLAELDELTIDLEAETVRTDGKVLFRSPEHRAVLRGVGLDSDMQFERVTIRSDIVATLPTEEGGEDLATISCDGPAIVTELEKDVYRIELKDRVRMRHRLVVATCNGANATVGRTASGETVLTSLGLEGAVDIDIDPEFSAGLEEIAATHVSFAEDGVVSIYGSKDAPVTAVRRGALPAFGLADRELDIRAPRVDLHVDRDRKEPLHKVVFPEGVDVRDRNGTGKFIAGHFVYDAAAQTIEATRGVDASGPGRFVRAESAFVTSYRDRKEVHLTLAGEKTLGVRFAGTLGPLGRTPDSMYEFSCDGPLLLVSQEKQNSALRAGGNVTLRNARKTLLSCDELTAEVANETPQRIVARGSVVANDHRRGATCRCDQLTYLATPGDSILLVGKPAVVKQPDREVRGNELRYDEDGAFSGKGNAWARIRLPKGEWTFSCDRAEGVAPAKGEEVPSRVVVEGRVKAQGPDGASLDADKVTFTKETGRLVLTGSPATLRQNAGTAFVGDRLEVDLVKTEQGWTVDAGETGGPAKLVVTPRRPAGDLNVARWEIDLKGAATYRNGEVQIPAGADVVGFDGQGKKSITLTGGAFVVRLREQRPVELIGTGEIDVETFKAGKRSVRLQAQSFTYELESSLMDVKGPGTVWQGDNPRATRFGEAKLEVVKDGVDLKYLGKLEVE